MVDEADKAQLEVVCVLKGIVDGELALPDGRVIRNRPADCKEHKVITIYFFILPFDPYPFSFPSLSSILEVLKRVYLGHSFRSQYYMDSPWVSNDRAG